MPVMRTVLLFDGGREVMLGDWWFEMGSMSPALKCYSLCSV